MRQSKEEYLMLRDEIIHLDSVINNTISFFYIFMATFLAFALTKNDTIYILLSHIVIIPSYLIVFEKYLKFVPNVPHVPKKYVINRISHIGYGGPILDALTPSVESSRII